MLSVVLVCRRICVVVVCKCNFFYSVATVHPCLAQYLLIKNLLGTMKSSCLLLCFKCLVIHMFVLLCCNNVSQNFEDNVTGLMGFSFFFFLF